MSLRTKTLLLFLAFVILPLILLGFVSSRETRAAMEEAARRNLQERVRLVAAGLEREVSRARLHLSGVAEDPEVLGAVERALSDGSLQGVAAEILARNPGLAPLVDSIHLRSPDGSVLSSAGSPPPVDGPARNCAPGAAVASLERQIGSGVRGRPDLTIVGYVSPARLLSSAGLVTGELRGQTIVVDRRSGSIVSTGACPTEGEVPPWLLTEAISSGQGSAPPVASGLTALFALEEPQWTVAAAVSAERVAAPLDRLGLTYAAFVLLVAAAAALAFHLLGGRLFRSFHELREAVEQIGKGDFAPWLPPPGRDEIGWLSLSLGRMAQRMNHMVQSVEQFGRLAVLGEMAAHVAHEIRTPLSSIKLNLQRLKRDVEAGIVPERSRASIEMGIREVDRLEGTVRNILQLGPPGQDRPRRMRSLHELICQAVDVMRDWIEDRDLTLSLDLAAESDRVRVDPGRTRGIFLNLLMNAAEATPAGGEISVETQLILRDDGKQMVAAAVSDTGSGVPPTIRHEIFNPFFTTKEDGNGLGLAAALKTAREHGGDLFLSNRPDGRSGGCFVVVFPLFAGESGESADIDELGALSGGKWLESEYHPTSRKPSFPWRPSRGKAEKGEARVDEKGDQN